MHKHYFSLIAAAILLNACSVTPDASDNTPPTHVISSLETPVKPIFRTDSNSPDENGLCPPGQSFIEAFGFLNASNPADLNSFVYVIPGNGDINLLVSFADPSGIKSASISMPAGTVNSPSSGVRVDTAQHGGLEFEVNQYRFSGNINDPRSPHLVNISVTPDSDDYRWFVLNATDFNNNAAASATYLIGNTEDLCE